MKKNRIVESREIACDSPSTVYIRSDLINFQDYIAMDLLLEEKKRNVKVKKWVKEIAPP